MNWISREFYDTIMNYFEQKTENDKITEINSVMMIGEEARGDLPLW